MNKVLYNYLVSGIAIIIIIIFTAWMSATHQSGGGYGTCTVINGEPHCIGTDN